MFHSHHSNQTTCTVAYIILDSNMISNQCID